MRQLYYKIIAGLLFCFLLTAVVLNSCRKLDKTIVISEEKIEARFFELPQNADPRIRAICGIIYRQQQQHHFLVDLTRRIGFPVWSKAAIVVKNGNTRTTGGDPIDNFILIPFVRGMENTVNAIVLGKISGRDTTLELVYDWEYSKYGFDRSQQINANKIFHLFTSLDYIVFGHTKFQIWDKRLTHDSTIRNGAFATLHPNQQMCPTCLIAIPITTCETYDYCYGPPGATCTDQPTTCTTGCIYYQYSETYCTTDWIYIEGIGSGGGGGGDDSGGGGVGGGGGGGGAWWPDPCKAMPQDEPCGSGPGWSPVLTPVEDPPTIDSTQLKQIYLAIQDSANHYYDNSIADSAEWCFTIVKNNGIRNKNPKTDHHVDDVTPNLFVQPGDTVMGFWHAHQGNIWLNLDLCFSPGDYFYVYRKLAYNNALVYATTKNFIYAIVIVDAQKFKTYLQAGGINLLNTKYYQGQASCTSGCSASRQSELGNVYIMGDPAVTGIKVYKSPRNNILFTTLN